MTLGILNPCDSLTPAWGGVALGGESETDLNIHPKPCSAGLRVHLGDRCLGLGLTLPVLKSRTLLWFHPPIFSHFSKCFHCGW